MGNITRNLSRHEFACRCGCGLADPHPLLCVGIQSLVDGTGAEKVIITSGSRCSRHNYEIGGADNSKHLVGRGRYTLAADCVFPGIPLPEVVACALLLPQFDRGGIGVYVGSVPRIHVDVRKGRARWGARDGESLPFEVARQIAKEA